MNASLTDIANSALTRVGQARVSDIADPSNEHARVLNGELPIQRDKLLRQFRWRFAIKRVRIAEDLDNTPAFGFTHAYQMPTECLSVVDVGDLSPGLDMSDYRNTDGADFSIEGRFILTNLGGPLNVRYVAQITIAETFDPHFVDALSAALAYHTCERITQSSSKKQLLAGDLKQAIADAVRANAIERPPQPVPDDTWMIGRLGSS